MGPQDGDAQIRKVGTSQDGPKEIGLRLKRIRAWNLRKIAELDIQVPPNIQFLCLVGPNGSGKSTIQSFLVDSLVKLTAEALPPDDEMGLQDVEHERSERVVTTSEVGPEDRAMAFGADWMAGSITLHHSSVCSSEGPLFEDDRQEQKVDRPRLDLTAIERLLEVKIDRMNGFSNSDRWHWKRTMPRLTKPSEDPIARSVLLERPATRFELPYCEEKARAVMSPSIGTHYYGQRVFPVRMTSGLRYIETLILDLTLDSFAKNEVGRWANEGLAVIKTALERLTKTEIEWRIPAWPFRRVELGPIHSLSLLSAGETDILVTVGLIVGQQLYLQRKFESELPKSPGGVVFIDELDAHLHPQWQEMAVPILADLFPSIQFVITTHSPFVLRSLPRDKAMVVRLPDAKVFEQDFSSWSADDILSAVFEIAPSWSREISEQLTNLRRLASDPRSAAETMTLYFGLAKRSESLRAECDRIIATFADMSLRDAIQAQRKEFGEAQL